MIGVKEKANYGKNTIPSIKGSFYFVPIVDEKEYNHVAETHDMALLIGLGIKYDGQNSQFSKMAARMLKIESVWAD